MSLLFFHSISNNNKNRDKNACLTTKEMFLYYNKLIGTKHHVITENDLTMIKKSTHAVFTVLACLAIGDWLGKN